MAPKTRVAEVSAASTTAAKNYITPSGLQRLRDELRFLLTRERPCHGEGDGQDSGALRDALRRRLPRPAATGDAEGESTVRNSQVAVLCAAIIGGALLVSATNVWLVRSLASPSPARPASGPAPAAAGRRPVIAMMPKAKGDPYFVSCRVGAEQAARELGVDLIWDGPTSLDAARQNDFIESWITRGVDVIAVAVENQPASPRCCARRANAGSRC